MAARNSKVVLHSQWREKIRASMLINRLRNHVLGRIDMSPTQLRAAEILLRKCIPDLAAVEHSTDGGQPLSVQLVAYHPPQLPSPELPVASVDGTGLRH